MQKDTFRKTGNEQAWGEGYLEGVLFDTAE